MKINLLVVVAAAALFFARGARADEVAPALEGADLRVQADAALRQLVGAKPDPKLRGLYAAFDPRGDDPLAQVACDDDGDYVIVLSDAMLRLVSFLARIDDAATYAAFLVRNQLPGKLLLQPPAGAFAATADEHASEQAEARVEAMLRFVYARELAHLRAGALVCPNPTPTRERGDAEWTAAEQGSAAATAARVYPRDEAIESNADVSGAPALLGFFAAYERERAMAHLVPSYLATHPRSAACLAAIRAPVATR